MDTTRSRRKAVVVAVVGTTAVLVTVLLASVCGTGNCQRQQRSAHSVASSPATLPSSNSLATKDNADKSPTPQKSSNVPSLLLTRTETSLLPSIISSFTPTLLVQAEKKNPGQPVPMTTTAPMTLLAATIQPSFPPTAQPTLTLTLQPSPIQPTPRGGGGPTDGPFRSMPTSVPTSLPTSLPTPLPTSLPTSVPTPLPTQLPTHTDGLTSGALITTDCLFQNDYPYAIDIFWSCGEERFNEPLRLHTFKRHSYNHGRIFRDQLLTLRKNGELWFEAYPRCMVILPNGQLGLSRNACSPFVFWVQSGDTYKLQDATSTQRCVGLGSGNTCDSDRSTGGRECGGVDHRFLPLEMVNCETNALNFAFVDRADSCVGEFPANVCF